MAWWIRVLAWHGGFVFCHGVECPFCGVVLWCFALVFWRCVLVLCCGIVFYGCVLVGWCRDFVWRCVSVLVLLGRRCVVFWCCGLLFWSVVVVSIGVVLW